jgi:hypothetical protein
MTFLKTLASQSFGESHSQKCHMTRYDFLSSRTSGKLKEISLFGAPSKRRVSGGIGEVING